MADVTGNIGNESVRLRGIALELTQEAMLRELQNMVDILEASNKINRDELGKLRKEKKKENDKAETDRIEQLGRVISKTGKDSEGFGKKITDVIKKFDNFGARLIDNGLMRTIRGFDSNVDDVSFAFKELSASSRGMLGTLGRFTAESVGQLQEQFDVYKKLTVVGGATAGDFADLRVNAARMGVTLRDYANIVEGNFLNLRLGGESVRKSLKGLTRDSERLRENQGQIADQFMELGVGANDFGRMIMQNTLLLGGYAKSQKTFANFDQIMLKMTKDGQALADAFGFNREQMMQAASKAMEDSNFAAIFDNIADSMDEAGKLAMPQIMTVFTNMAKGDTNLAKKMFVSAYTGMVDSQVGGIEAASDGMFVSTIKKFVESVTKGMPVEEAIKGMDPLLKHSQDMYKNMDVQLGAFAGAGGDAFKGGLTILNDLNRMFVKDPKSILRTLSTTADKTSADQLKSFGTLQRQNIELAVQFATVNKVMNEFGLGVANVLQLMTLSALVYGKSLVNDFKGSAEYEALIKDIEAAKSRIPDIFKNMQSVSQIADDIVRKEREARGEVEPPRPATQKPEAGLPERIDPDAKVTVQNSKATSPLNVGRATFPNAEAFARGDFDLPLRQALSVFASSKELGLASGQTLNLSAGNDAHHKGEGQHGAGLAMDLTVPGMGADGYKSLASKMNGMMDTMGFKNGEASAEFHPKGYLGSTGDHIHFQFKDQGSARRFQEEFEKRYGTSGQGGAVTTGGLFPSGGNGSNGGNALAAAQIDGAGVMPVSLGASPNSSISNTSNGVITLTMNTESANILADAIYNKFTGDLGSLSSILSRSQFMSA